MDMTSKRKKMNFLLTFACDTDRGPKKNYLQINDKFVLQN